MAVVKTRFKALPAAEQKEIDDAVASAKGQKFGNDRFVSDEGDTMAWFLLLFLASAGGGIALVVEGNVVESVQMYAQYPSLITGIWRNVSMLGLVACCVVAPLCVFHFIRVHGRHGWLLTSTAVVKLRGPKVQKLAFSDIVKTERTKHGGRGRRFSHLTMTLKDGSSWSTYATQLMDTIQSRVGS